MNKDGNKQTITRHMERVLENCFRDLESILLNVTEMKGNEKREICHLY